MNLKLAPILIIIFAVVMRLLPHPPNMAPITAMALFGGAYLPKKYALTLPIIALLISDYFIGFYGLTMFFVYASFLLVGGIGIWLKKHPHPSYILSATLFSSFLFFLITNFGVWLTTSMYTKDFPGLVNCYTMAIPFYRNTIIGDLIFTTLIFVVYNISKQVAQRMIPANYFIKIY